MPEKNRSHTNKKENQQEIFDKKKPNKIKPRKDSNIKTDTTPNKNNPINPKENH